MISFFRKPGAALFAAFGIVALSAPAQAQFGGLLRSVPQTATTAATTDADGCPQGKKKSTGSKILGGVLGQVARNAASQSGVSSWVPISDVSDQLTNAIACRLDPEEQKQAAEATLQATRGADGDAEVGASASWTSNTRADVSGTSTVVARANTGGSGLDCITVNDVIIVSGEETTASKRMCKPPGSARYTLAA